MSDTVEPLAEGLDSSLASYSITVPSEVEGKCPRKLNYQWHNIVTGEIRPARCRANWCGFCGPVNARLIGGAIALARPERMVLLTQVGNDFQTVRARLKRLAYDLRQTGAEVEWSWHVEPNPKGTGHHVHAWQRGDFIPQSHLSRLADKRGMGPVVRIRKWETRGSSVGYGVKLAGVSYGLKNAESVNTMGTYLRANGARLVHSTRGFWLDEHGEHVGQREAMVAWVRSQRSDDSDDWQLTRVA